MTWFNGYLDRRWLLVYLPPNAQDQLFDIITTLNAAGSQVATEHFPDYPGPAECARQVSVRLSRLGLDVNLSESIDKFRFIDDKNRILIWCCSPSGFTVIVAVLRSLGHPTAIRFYGSFSSPTAICGSRDSPPLHSHIGVTEGGDHMPHELLFTENQDPIGMVAVFFNADGVE
ncbi:hypothetical protein [Mycobacterium simulans]|uniref:hypothetical protein n=1 Tax=Mycobacterium simulans TaxID=627089 RepID=UPI001640FE83|nr:hypothetical protein [Mycobacterium simulans]